MIIIIVGSPSLSPTFLNVISKDSDIVIVISFVTSRTGSAFGQVYLPIPVNYIWNSEEEHDTCVI